MDHPAVSTLFRQTVCKKMSEITESLPQWPGVQKTNENVLKDDKFKKTNKKNPQAFYNIDLCSEFSIKLNQFNGFQMDFFLGGGLVKS